MPYRKKAYLIYRDVRPLREYRHIRTKELQEACLLAVQGHTAKRLYYRMGKPFTRPQCKQIVALVKEQRKREKEIWDAENFPNYLDAEPLSWTVKLVL